jgi:outer membrane protein insertion porin family
MKIRSQVLFLLIGTLFSVPGAKLLDTLVIEGLSINSPGVVRNALEIREKKEFATSDIQESLRKLYSLGLFKTVDFLIMNENDSSVALKLIIEENPMCQGIEYHGNKKLKNKDFDEKLKMKKGQVISSSIVHQNEQIIKKLYAEKGYNLAEVKSELVKSTIPGNVFVKFNIKEGAKVKIRNITFTGNTQIPTKKLLKKFKTKEARWFRSGELKKELYQAHIDTLLMFYNDRGFLDASVVKDTIWYSDNKKDINIAIDMFEGKKYYTGDFFFQGNRIIVTDSLSKKIALKRSTPFQKNRFEMTKYMIENAYREEGYLWVQVEDQRKFRGDTIDVTFAINEGRSAIVKKVDVKGNNKTMEKVIRREIDLLPGKKYKQSLMMRSRQNLMALNYFSDVRPDLAPNDDGTIDLVFDVVEKDNIGQLQIGAAYQAYDGFVGTFSTTIPNFRGAGQLLGVNVEYGKYRQNIRLSFTEPWAFDLPLSLSGSVFYTNSDYSNYYTSSSMAPNYDYNLSSYGFTIGAGLNRLRWPDDRFKVNAMYRLSRDESNAISKNYPEDHLRTIEEGFLSRLSFGLQRYDLDMPLFPTSGSRLSIEPEIAGLGGDFHYLKTMVSYEHYFALPFKLVMGSRTKLGNINKFIWKDINISNYDLFKVGGVFGDGDLRGYEEYSFGGWTSNENTGLNMLTSTFELRYPLLDQQLYIGTFLDYGNTWAKLSEVNLKDVYKGVGVGVRLNVPMLGIMGFDFAWGLNHPTADPFKSEKNNFKFHFLMNRGF